MLNIPSTINDEVVLNYAIQQGYQSQIIVTPATQGSQETLSYDSKGNPIDVPAVLPTPAVMGDNPVSPEDFVTDFLTNEMIASYKTAQISAAVAQAVQDATEQATQTVEASISEAKNNMAQKAQIKA
jgi:hypothetical protein